MMRFPMKKLVPSGSINRLFPVGFWRSASPSVNFVNNVVVKKIHCIRSVSACNSIAARSFSSGADFYRSKTPLQVSTGNEQGKTLKFHHLHLYVDNIASLKAYKAYEKRLNELGNLMHENGVGNSETGVTDEKVLSDFRKIWEDMNDGNVKDPEQYTPFGQDVVAQMLFGAGWRISGVHEGMDTTSFHVSTRPSHRDGVAVVVTALKKLPDGEPTANLSSYNEKYDHFHPKNLQQYFEAHGYRQGCAVLAFKCEDVSALVKIYKEKHPTLIRAGFPKTYGGGARIFEAYAYYANSGSDKPDMGTVIRFVQEAEFSEAFPLPGMERVMAEFPKDGDEMCAAYSDHWVSNVFDRERVLQTFEDVLGFEAKVNFNAGVVGAGEAVIESTVTGNEPGTDLVDKEEWFKNQDQIYLPINNALSPHGHVFMYLEQVGQGVQHFACRVKNLPDFISRANRYRKVTGEGLSFLNIPRSYYGWLELKDLDKTLKDCGVTSGPKSEDILKMLQEEKIADDHAILDLNITNKQIKTLLQEKFPDLSSDLSGDQTVSSLDALTDTILKARYSNLYAMMTETFTPDEYVKIVENQILVDVQGKDVLLQIFTNPVLMRKPGQQAPFFEYIQRVCDTSAATLKPGCGGFGIRNFLTLFLSIEVSNFMDQMELARRTGDKKGMEKCKKAVEIFSSQLHQSNPVLSAMSECLEMQSEAQEKLLKCATEAEKEKHTAELEKWEREKEKIQETLMEIGESHKKQMQDLMKAYE